MADPLKDFNDLDFGIRKSIRYHVLREKFFTRIHDGAMFVSFLSGTASVATLSEMIPLSPPWSLGASGFITLVIGVVLVFRLTDKIALHRELRRDFVLLQKNLVKSRHGSAEELKKVVQEITEERLSIELREPPVLHILNVMCHNEVMRSDRRYENKPYRPITWTQRKLSQFTDWKWDPEKMGASKQQIGEAG